MVEIADRSQVRIGNFGFVDDTAMRVVRFDVGGKLIGCLAIPKGTPPGAAAGPPWGRVFLDLHQPGPDQGGVADRWR